MSNRIVEQAGVFTDLAAVRRLQSASLERDEAIRAASRQFESFMTAMVLKSMRQANAVFEQGNPFHDNASQVYRDLLDQQMSLDFSSRSGSGLANRLAQQLGASAEDREVPLSESERTALDRVSRLRLRRPLLASMIVGPRQEGLAGSVPPAVSIQPGAAASAVASAASAVPAAKAGLGERPVSARALIPANPTAQDRKPASADGDTTPVGKAVSQDSDFSSPEDFIDAVFPAAVEVAGELGVDPAVLVAQSALETGWGQHMIRRPQGQPSYNLFGIKADQRWQGDVAKVTTTEYVAGKAVKEVAAFRAYGSYEESFRDYLDFVRNQPRYASAVALAEQPEGYMTALQEAGYATDPDYADKVARIFHSDTLQRARVEWLARGESTAGDKP